MTTGATALGAALYPVSPPAEPVPSSERAGASVEWSDPGGHCAGNYAVADDSALFFCMPPGTPYINDAGVRPAACGVGGVGVPTSAIETCEDDAPCCTTFCDLSEMDTCAQGFVCTSFLREGKFPGEFNVGVCVSPPEK